LVISSSPSGSNLKLLQETYLLHLRKSYPGIKPDSVSSETGGDGSNSAKPSADEGAEIDEEAEEVEFVLKRTTDDDDNDNVNPGSIIHVIDKDESSKKAHDNVPINIKKPEATDILPITR